MAKSRIRPWVSLVAGILAGTAVAFSTEYPAEPVSAGNVQMDRIAESYVRLVLAMEHHDPGYVDSYFGPEEWRTKAAEENLGLTEIKSTASDLIHELETVKSRGANDFEMLRRTYVLRHLNSLEARVDLLQGKQFTFDEETRALFGVSPEVCDEENGWPVYDGLDRALPGEGELCQRYERFIANFYVPSENVTKVFEAAIQECRERTRRHIELPAGECVEIEYVSGQPWKGFAVYQGELRSHVCFNTSVPLLVDDILALAAHEVYPGHHVQVLLQDFWLWRQSGWVEFCVVPLYSPLITRMEGCAEYGIRIAFPTDEQTSVVSWLFEIAGLDPARAEEYCRVRNLMRSSLGLCGSIPSVSCVGTAAARKYAEGEMTRSQMAEWLRRFTFVSLVDAQVSVDFVDHFRSYYGAYGAACEVIEHHMGSEAETVATQSHEWRMLYDLYTSPLLPTNLDGQ